jgi:hypothetical protein
LLAGPLAGASLLMLAVACFFVWRYDVGVTLARAQDNTDEVRVELSEPPVFDSASVVVSTLEMDRKNKKKLDQDTRLYRAVRRGEVIGDDFKIAPISCVWRKLLLPGPCVLSREPASADEWWWVRSTKPGHNLPIGVAHRIWLHGKDAYFDVGEKFTLVALEGQLAWLAVIALWA